MPEDAARGWFYDRAELRAKTARGSARGSSRSRRRPRETGVSAQRAVFLHLALGLDEAALLILEDEHVLDWRRRTAARSVG